MSIPTPLPMAAIERISTAARAADGTDPLDESARITLRKHPDQVVWEVAGDGFALAHGGQVNLVVKPEARDRAMGETLLRHLLERLGDGPLTAWSHGHHPAADRLADRFGFTKVRDLWVMRRRSSAPLPAERPRDWELRTYQRSDRDELLRVNAAAFADHPEQGSMDATNLADRMSEPWYRPEDLLVAERGGRMLGFHWTKRHSPTEGEVYVVGVAPEAQGQGLGTALTVAGLDHLAKRGITDVHLYVESDNTAAVALYRKLGFTHAEPDTHVMYARP